MTKVSIAIVRYHSALVLDALTQALRAQREVSYEVLFTDNGSTDGTVETLANLWSGRRKPTPATSATLRRSGKTWPAPQAAMCCS